VSIMAALLVVTGCAVPSRPCNDCRMSERPTDRHSHRLADSTNERLGSREVRLSPNAFPNSSVWTRSKQPLRAANWEADRRVDRPVLDFDARVLGSAFLPHTQIAFPPSNALAIKLNACFLKRFGLVERPQVGGHCRLMRELQSSVSDRVGN